MSSVVQELFEDGITLDRGHVHDRVADRKTRVSPLFDDVASWFPDLASDRSDAVEMNEQVMRKHGMPPARLPVLPGRSSSGDCARPSPTSTRWFGPDVTGTAADDRFCGAGDLPALPAAR